MIAILSSRIGLVAIASLLSFQLSSLVAQEAVPEKPLTAAEETPARPAEATPTATAKEKPAAAKPKKAIEDMTEEEKAAAGLDKLSPAELEYLDEWLRNYRRGAEKKAAEKAATEAKVEAAQETTETKKRTFLKSEALVSHVDGTMVQLTGKTIIRLEDGTRWKQANYGDRFYPRVKDHPAVAVFLGQFGYMMRIEGMQDFYVDPVKD